MTARCRAFVEAEKHAGGNVRKACDLLEVSRSAFYDSIGRPPSARARTDAELLVMITAAHERSRGTYGAPRIHHDLREAGVHVGRKRVARLMAAAGMVGRCRRRRRRTTIAGEEVRALNIINRVFDPGNWEIDRAWCSDITYVRTWEGWAYLATIIDLASRRVVGWALADHLETDLVTEALGMAIAARRPAPGLILHADRGCQYTSSEFPRLLDDNGMVQSLARVGQCWDNSVAESWFATYKTELIYNGVWPTISALRTATFDYIEISTTVSDVTTRSAASAPSATNNPAKPPLNKRPNHHVRQTGVTPDCDLGARRRGSPAVAHSKGFAAQRSNSPI